jgi:hypothetical protein
VQDYHKVLRRIAAILLALAALAERASRRSGPVRSLVLWILRAADAAASAFAAEIAPLAPIALATLQPGDGRDDAVRLAEKFRLLAAAFFALAHEAQRLAIRQPSQQPNRECLARRAHSERLLRAISALQPRYADTS